MDSPTLIKIVTIITLGVVLLATVIVIGIVAILTDRQLARAEYLSFGGVIMLGLLGGVSWWTASRHKWHVRVDRNGNGEENHG